MSWEDFKSDRGIRNITSDGERNPWNVNPREKWESFRFSSVCETPSESFRHKMSNLFSKSFKEKCHNDTEKLDFVIPKFRF